MITEKGAVTVEMAQKRRKFINDVNFLSFFVDK